MFTDGEAIKLNKTKMLQLISLEVKILQGFEYSSKLSQIYLLNFCRAFWGCRLTEVSRTGRTGIQLEIPKSVGTGKQSPTPAKVCLLF